MEYVTDMDPNYSNSNNSTVNQKHKESSKGLCYTLLLLFFFFAISTLRMHANR